MSAPKVPLSTLFASFFATGCVAYGGPAMIKEVRRLVVEKRAWLSEAEFKRGLALAQALPGGTVVQVAAYTGNRLSGTLGALAAFLGFWTPAFVLMTGLSLLYFTYGGLPLVAQVFEGLRAVVAAIMADAFWALAVVYARGTRKALVAAVAAGLFFAGLSPILVMLGAVAAMMLMTARHRSEPVAVDEDEAELSLRGSMYVLGGGVGILALLFQFAPTLFDLGSVFAKINLFAFGGVYGSLPLMIHEVVEVFGWMPRSTFMDGVALGQITPGPIIMTAAFVGQAVAGVAGALVAALYAFFPSLVTILASAPFYERLRSSWWFAPYVEGAILSLVGLVFGVAVLFALDLPRTAFHMLVAAGAFLALRLRVPVVAVVGMGLAAAFAYAWWT